ncbi:GAF domain-containing protein [Candidatus Bathyarchaeota archaeon]|nr:GAF domain-containing protein [Candidatus Bathyarchaeota archaeon]
MLKVKDEHDIELKRLRIRKNEEFFYNIVENSHEGIVIINDKFRLIYVNRKVSQILGYPKDELIGQDFRKFLDKENRGIVENFYLLRQRGKEAPEAYKIKIVRKDGEKRDVEVRATVIRDCEGKPKTIGHLLDITEHKRLEGKLSALNIHGQKLNMTENIKEIYKLTLDIMEKTLGFGYASILMVKGKNLQVEAYRGHISPTLILPLDGERGITVKAAKTGKPIIISDIRKEKSYVIGKPGMLSELAVPIKIGKEVLGVLNVETDRINAFNQDDLKLLEILASHVAIAILNLRRKDELREISEKLANLMKCSTKIMHIRNMHTRLKTIAEAIRKFGWRRVVISLRDENLEITDQVTSGLTEDEVKLLWERRAPGHVWRERLGPKFEKFRIGEFYYLPWRDPWVREHVHGVPPDVPLEKATTYWGIPSKLSPEEMVDWHPQDMIYAPLRTPEGKIVGILSMDDPVDGRRPTKEKLAPLELFLHQAAITIENAKLINDLKTARKQLETYAKELELKVKERTRQLEESHKKLLKAQRLAVIGELAGMIGHDLRNPLTSISVAVYYLKKKLSSQLNDELREMIELIEKNIAYSNKIINDLLDYSREVVLEPSLTTPSKLIKESLSMVKIPENIQVLNLTENKPKMQVDVGKIKRVFSNIIKNAVDAMPEGGKLIIKSLKTNDNVKFTFTDTGIGMSKETLSKLWTPLFTTKPKGMGFGLPICKRFVEAHEGSITVKSTPNKGTTFTVTLPIKLKKGGEKIWVKNPESSLLTTTKT